MSFFPFFEWAQNTGVGMAIRSSLWLLPLVDIVHLFGLALVFGATLVLNLRMLRVFLPSQPAPEVAKVASPWFWRGLTISVLSGALLFLANAIKCYSSPPFYLKMALLGAGITFQATVHRRLALAGSEGAAQIGAGVCSLVLWLAIPVVAFWIELY